VGKNIEEQKTHAHCKLDTKDYKHGQNM